VPEFGDDIRHGFDLAKAFKAKFGKPVCLLNNTGMPHTHPQVLHISREEQLRGTTLKRSLTPVGVYCYRTPGLKLHLGQSELRPRTASPSTSVGSHTRKQRYYFEKGMGDIQRFG
jgi:hypothetical protein